MWVITTSIFWTALGVLVLRLQLMPLGMPQLLGRTLYWLGVPLQIIALARRSNFAQAAWIPPLITVTVLFLGLGLALLSLQGLKRLTWHCLAAKRQPARVYRGFQLPFVPEVPCQVLPRHRSGRGSFILASMLGNTGFLGLSLAPAFVSTPYLGWIVLYGVTHNLFGSYGLGVLLASYFGRSQHRSFRWTQLRDVLCVPALWAFVIGWYTRLIEFPFVIEAGLQSALVFVIPGAFLLIGMQLSKLQGVKSLQSALVPTILKVLILPGLVGLSLSLIGLTGDARFALVLMSGMPTAFANVILAEEYNLDRQLAAGSVVLGTVTLPLMIPLWLYLFK